MGTKDMKTAFLSILFAAAVVTTANAAKHTQRHHVTHAAQPATASTSDWPGNPYMDLKQSQVERFWQDAFNPLGAK
jgi:hypothetical protein